MHRRWPVPGNGLTPDVGFRVQGRELDFNPAPAVSNLVESDNAQRWCVVGEEMLMDADEHRRVCIMRRVLADMNPPDAMELLTRQLMKTKTNAEFLMSMNMK